MMLFGSAPQLKDLLSRAFYATACRGGSVMSVLRLSGRADFEGKHARKC